MHRHRPLSLPPSVSPSGSHSAPVPHFLFNSINSKSKQIRRRSMEMEGLDDFYKIHRFKPSDEEAVTYFLPRLLAGSPLPYGADRLIRHADIYGASEPKDLAAEYAPVPSAVSTGDRFFFTTCKGEKGRFARVAGAGTWSIQKTKNVYDAGVKVGEVKHLSFKKSKVSTGWVMEEYRCLLPEAIIPGGEKVLCKIHLAPKPPAAARQESDAYKLRQERAEPPVQEPEPVTVIASTHGQKRPAPPVAAADLSSCKKMRMAAPVPVPEPEEEEYEDCPTWSTPAAPVSLPAASIEVPAAAEADDDTGRFSCTMEELLGEVQQQEQIFPAEAENNLDQLVFDEDVEHLDIDQLAARIDWDDQDLLRPWSDYDQEEETTQTVGGMVQEEQTLPIQAENNMERYQQLVASIDREYSEELHSLLADHDEEEAQLYRRCSYNVATADLQAPWLEGRSNFFSFGAVN